MYKNFSGHIFNLIDPVSWDESFFKCISKPWVRFSSGDFSNVMRRIHAVSFIGADRYEVLLHKHSTFDESRIFEEIPTSKVGFKSRVKKGEQQIC